MQNSDFWSRITSIYVSQLSSVVFAYTTVHPGPEFQVCTGPRLHLWFWAHITAFLTQEYKDYMCSSPRLWFCACKTATLALELLVSMGPRPHLPFCAIKTAWFAPEYQVYIGSNQHLWFCAYKTATLGPDLQVCMGPRPHLWFWAHITAYLAKEWIDYIGSNSHLSFCACKTACLASELLVSMGPSPHVCFLHAKQRLLDRNNKSLRVPDKTCHFVHGKQQL